MADIRKNFTFFDDFNRANETPLSGGGNWAGPSDNAVWPTSPLSLLSNVATHKTGRASSDSYWTPRTYDGDDAEAWAYTKGGNASGIAWGIALWKDVGGSNAIDGYRFRVEVSSGGGSYVLRRFTNGGSVRLAAVGGAATGGDYFMLIRRNGSSVECWTAPADASVWTLRVSAVDTTYMTGFHLGLGITDNSGAHALAWDNFGGGPAPVTTFLPQIYRRTRLRGGR